MPLILRAAVAILIVLLTSSPARADDPAAHALIDDISRIVGSEQSSGWFIDARALDEIHATVMESACRTPDASRQSALEILRRRVARLGTPRELWERAGREMNEDVERALRAERELRALERALDKITECPFWVEPEPDFRGRQSDADRFTLSIETGGLVQLRQTADTWTFGGGGYGRLLPGYGFDGHVSVLAGAEFGGGAMLRPDTSPTELVINYFPAIPVLVRCHDGGWHYDIETAPVGLFQADDSSLSLGARIGGAIGIKALRTRGVLPWAGLALAYEHYFPSGGRGVLLRGGLRVGLMWDP
jgi:hypothetical protein